jgi:hypothetical protein
MLSALLLVVTAIAAIPPNDMDAARTYRVRPFKLRDICPAGLPWTNEERLSFPARKPRDEYGVPMIIVEGERYYRPGALAINGMKRLAAYRDTGDRRQVEQALAQAKRLRLMSQDRRSASWLPFLYDYLPAGQRAPWFNAMVQGLALSFFVRLYHVTGDEIHLKASDRIFRSFMRLGKSRPTWMAYVDAQRYLWLEHYPLRRPDHVLNAHMHAIFGLYEYWQATRSPEAQRVLKGAITTMRNNAARYRRPGGLSLYGLRLKTRHRKYHEVHVWQFNLLARISGDRYFQRFGARLARDAPPIGYVPGRPAQHGNRVVSPTCRPAPPFGSPYNDDPGGTPFPGYVPG